MAATWVPHLGQPLHARQPPARFRCAERAITPRHLRHQRTLLDTSRNCTSRRAAETRGGTRLPSPPSPRLRVRRISSAVCGSIRSGSGSAAPAPTEPALPRLSRSTGRREHRHRGHRLLPVRERDSRAAAGRGRRARGRAPDSGPEGTPLQKPRLTGRAGRRRGWRSPGRGRRRGRNGLRGRCAGGTRRWCGVPTPPPRRATPSGPPSRSSP